MRFLLVNDDGYDARGINIVFSELKKFGEVVMLAPRFHQSGKSCSITIGKPIDIIKHDENIYSCNGTPADCVRLALGYFEEKFDVVVSGCNHGYNVSYDTLYSGTIGAGLQALMANKKTICLSAHHKNLDIVEKELNGVLSFVFDKDLMSNKYLLNINFPSDKHTVSKGIKLATEYKREFGEFLKKTDDGYIVDRNKDEIFPSTIDDSYLVENGYIAISPLKASLYSSNGFEELKNKLNK